MRAGGCSGDCHSVWVAVAGGLAEGTNVMLKHVGCEGRRQEHGERVAKAGEGSGSGKTRTAKKPHCGGRRGCPLEREVWASVTLAGADAEGCRSWMDVAGERVGAEAMDPRGIEKFVSEGRQRAAGGRWADRLGTEGFCPCFHGGAVPQASEV